ncbi:hypothetical protein HHI36_004119 [Cryptolaemus montrouzieri]|uniref:Uncharacterized protein n=1 Tax=Cryptolaemus montrouzieri TaxID=559131 RepID=A0ABD2NQV6_9CUCU
MPLISLKMKQKSNTEADLDKKYLPLWNLLKHSLDNDVESKLAGVNLSLDNNESKISEMADRVTLLESSGGSHSCNSEAFFNELRERQLKEKNIIMFNLPDGKSADKNDISVVKQLFSDASYPNDQLINIKTMRLGRIFKEGIQTIKNHSGFSCKFALGVSK